MTHLHALEAVGEQRAELAGKVDRPMLATGTAYRDSHVAAVIALETR